MRSLTCATFLILTTAFGASAANIFIDDRTEGFATVFGVPDCNGTTITTNCVTNKSNFSNEGLFFTFVSDIPVAVGFGGDFHSILLEGPWEPNETPPGAPSDWLLFHLVENSPNIDVRVCSDPDTNSLICAIPTNSVQLPQSPQIENGGFQLMAQYVFVLGANQGQEIDNFFLASDAPEPASMLFLGSGLVAVGLISRRRRKA